MRRKAYTLAKEIGLTRQQRVDLSNMVTQIDHDSWMELTDEQLGRVIDAMCGYVYIHFQLDLGDASDQDVTRPAASASQ